MLQGEKWTLFDGIVIAASASLYSLVCTVINLTGAASLLLQNSGDGTATVTYESSHDGVNWAQMETLADSALLVGFTKTSGPAADGKVFHSFSLPVSAFLRLKVTETAGLSSLTITATLGVL